MRYAAMYKFDVGSWVMMVSPGQQNQIPMLVVNRRIEEHAGGVRKDYFVRPQLVEAECEWFNEIELTQWQEEIVIESMARRTAELILADLDDRAGFDMKNLRDDIREEIISEWTAIVQGGRRSEKYLTAAGKSDGDGSHTDPVQAGGRSDDE